MEIKNIAVLGAGTMGHGIAQVCAQNGLQVSLEDLDQGLLQTGMKKIRAFLQGSVERKKMTGAEAEAVLSRLRAAPDLKSAVEGADLVIEAIVEKIEVKRETFGQLDRLCPEHTVFASNSSYLCITEMAAATKRPDRVLGMHWFNPPQIMKGIEVIRTEKTSPETLETIVALCKKMGKEPAVCKDSPGFIANRLLQAWRAESLRLYDEGIADFRDIDAAFKVAYGFRMGPFELTDLTGLDIALIGSETMYREMGSPIFKPPRCLIMKVKSGELGRKSGRGFYDYPK